MAKRAGVRSTKSARRNSRAICASAAMRGRSYRKRTRNASTMCIAAESFEMARLSDLPEWERPHHLDKIKALPDYGPTPFAPGPQLARRRVAIVTTAGLHVRGDRPFEVGSSDYRVILGDVASSDVVMSHISVNYDRTGFQEDI